MVEFEKACESLHKSKSLKRKETRDDNEDGLAPTPKLKQVQLTDSFHLPLTQLILDGYVLDYITESVLSVNYVESDGFKTFIQRLSDGRLLPQCRQTVTKQLEEHFEKRKSNLKQILKSLGTVCTTADCWTSRRRSFLGVTVHWLDTETLERKGGCLAIRQLSGSHTYDLLAKTLEGINNEFDIGNKTCFTVTDSGSNFIKAFKHFSLEDAEILTVVGNEAESTADDDELQFEEISDLL